MLRSVIVHVWGLLVATILGETDLEHIRNPRFSVEDFAIEFLGEGWTEGVVFAGRKGDNYASMETDHVDAV